MIAPGLLPPNPPLEHFFVSSSSSPSIGGGFGVERRRTYVWSTLGGYTSMPVASIAPGEGPIDRPPDPVMPGPTPQEKQAVRTRQEGRVWGATGAVPTRIAPSPATLGRGGTLGPFPQMIGLARGQYAGARVEGATIGRRLSRAAEQSAQYAAARAAELRQTVLQETALLDARRRLANAAERILGRRAPESAGLRRRRDYGATGAELIAPGFFLR